jgi:hypothetical protein
VVDLFERRQRTGMRRLRQRGKNIGLLVPPAELMRASSIYLRMLVAQSM